MVEIPSKIIHVATFEKRHAKGTNSSDPYLLSGTYIDIRLRHFLQNHRDDIRVTRSGSVKCFWSKLSSENARFREFSHIRGHQETCLDVLN